ncbi:MAG: TRIC cation channel family protein [Desulfovibrio sp.]|jgi:uncharacterized membrane protein YeiH|nr:TRIC cation channel family protein [Desulfovibrio sp.]
MIDVLHWLGAAGIFVPAAAAGLRARQCGSHFTGAAVLGCLVGLSAPLFMDCLLGMGVPAILTRETPLGATALGGVLGALFGAFNPATSLVFGCLDALGLGLVACLGSLQGLAMGLPATGCLILGCVSGLIPGILRDMLDGEPILALESDFYVSAAILGQVLTIGSCFYSHMPRWACVLLGALVCAMLRGVRIRREAGR